MKTLFTLLMVAFLSMPAQAAKEPLKNCLSSYDVDVLKHSMRIRIGGDWDLCDPKNRFYQLAEGLFLLRDLQWHGKTAPHPYNQEIIGYSWFSLLRQYVGSIAWGETQSRSTCKSANAYANTGTREMATCLNLYATEENVNYAGYTNVVSMVKVLMHETRHLMDRRDGFPHSDCQGIDQYCDRSIGYQGAYAVSVETFAKLGITASNLHPAQSSYARRMAYVTASERFVKPAPISKVEEGKRLPAFRTKENKFLSYANGKIIPFMHDLPAGQFIPWDSFGFETYLFIPADPSQLPKKISSYSYWPKVAYETFNTEEGSEIDQRNDYLASPMISSLIADRSLTLKDSITYRSFMSGTFRFFILGDKIIVERLSEKEGNSTFLDKAEFTLPNGEIPIALRNGSVSEKTDTGYIHVLSDKDHLYKFNYKHDEKYKLVGVEMLEVANPFPGYTHAYAVDNFTFLLDKQGNVFRERDGLIKRYNELQSYGFTGIAFHWYHEQNIPDELSVD